MKIGYHFKIMTFLVLLTNIIPPLCIDEYTPSFPYMVKTFQVSESLIQLSLTVYLLAFALSQLIGGVFSDRFGRRRSLLFSMPIFLLGSLVVIFSSDITWLMMGRVLQGLGVGISALTGPALMSDCFDGEDLTRVSSYYGTVYAFIPISAPVLGGFLQEYFGWRANFILMFVLGFIIYIWFFIKLPETHKANLSYKLTATNIIKSYLSVLMHKRYMLSVGGLMLIWSLFMVFSVMAPFLLQQRLGFSPSTYGLLALLVGLGFFVGTLINNQMIKFFLADSILLFGLVAMMILSAILLFFKPWLSLN